MKKWVYLISGVAIGAIIATSGSALASQVNSLIGQKVTGEYTVVINGNKLTGKGAVINGKTQAPVREISDSLGADLKIEGRTITITTPVSEQGTEAEVENKYSGLSKSSIETTLKSLKDNVLPFNEQDRENILKEIEQAKTAGAKELQASKEKQLAECEARIEKTKADIAAAEAALATAN